VTYGELFQLSNCCKFVIQTRTLKNENILLKGEIIMMLYLVQFLQRFQKDEKGQALTEYGLIIALIAIVVIGAVTVIGTNLDSILDSIGTALKPAS
jgi:pilus assembly protein Flp/PilA